MPEAPASLVAYLLIGKTARLRQTQWLTAEHHRAAARGSLQIVNMQTGHRLTRHGWRPIPPRRGEPLVMLVPEGDEEYDEYPAF